MPRPRLLPPTCAAATALLLALAGPAVAEEHFFLIVFGSQRRIHQPDYTHSSAAFVKATGEGPDLGKYKLDVHTISWLPATLNVRVLSLLPEPGVNLDMHSTLRLALARREVLARWGPYKIKKELYDKAQEQLTRLKAGSIQYKALDSGFPSDAASNCIHAVGDVVGHGRLRIGTPGWGHFASYVLTLRFRQWILDEGKVYPEVAAGLGLGAYPMKEMDLSVNPRDWLGLGLPPPKRGNPNEDPEPPLAPRKRLIPRLLPRLRPGGREEEPAGPAPENRGGPPPQRPSPVSSAPGRVGSNHRMGETPGAPAGPARMPGGRA